MSLRRNLLGLLCLTLLQAQSAELDSLVRWNELEFSSDFERTAFHSFFRSDEKDFLQAFLGNAPDAAKYAGYFKDKIDATIADLTSSGALTKRNDKKVKAIYQAVHQRFLSKYEMECRFYEIMSSGNYNCATATALYAYVFDKTGVSYNIMEKPTHVYLVAYPEKENIMIETTTPMFGFMNYAPEFKANYVKTLQKQKIIGSQESVGTNTDELFNKYFYGTDNISMTQLVGIQYMNDGMYRRDHEDIVGSYQQLMKGYMFYPCPKSEYLLMASTVMMINEKSLDPATRASMIGRYSRFEKFGAEPEEVMGEFQRLTQQVLNKNNDRDLYRKCYEAIISEVRNPELAADLTYYYNYEVGRIFFNQGNYHRAKPYFAASLQAQPRNADIGALYIDCLGKSLVNERDPRALVDTLESNLEMYPMLEEFPNYMAMLGLSYVNRFGSCYDEGDAVCGEEYRKKFEDLYDKQHIRILSEGVVGRAYSEAAVYHFRKGQKTKAKAIIDRGLQIVPDEYQLRSRKQMIGG
jgi:tetratricopeptide (TPR) repeat protein